jgi:hypothetical protein
MAITFIKRLTGSMNNLIQVETSDTTAIATAANYITSQTPTITALNDGTWGWQTGDCILLLASDGISWCNINSMFTTLTAFAGFGEAAVTFDGTLVNGNVPKFDGTAGVIQDSGIAASNIVVKNAVNTMAAGSEIVFDKAPGTVSAGAVTINKQTGVITTTSLTTAAGSTTTVTLNNSEVLTSSVVLVSLMGGVNTTLGVQLSAAITSAGVVTITIGNNNASAALNGTLIIGFAIL